MMETAQHSIHTQRVSILLMCIVDTVAQVAARGQWRPLFDVAGQRVSLYFRRPGLGHAQHRTFPASLDIHEASITARDDDDARQQLDALEAMLACARRHLKDRPEAA